MVLEVGTSARLNPLTERDGSTSRLSTISGTIRFMPPLSAGL